MKTEKKKIMEALDVSQSFFDNDERLDKEYNFLLFVVWKTHSFGENDAEEFLHCMESGFQKMGLPKELPLFLEFYLIEMHFKEKGYEVILPLPKEELRVQFGWIFIPKESVPEVTPGVMLTPELSRELLNKVSDFLDKKMNYEGANCLGEISFHKGEVSLYLNRCSIDKRAYGKRFSIRRAGSYGE